MAVTQNTYTGNGATVLYSFTFPYLETTDVKVTINGTPTTAYTFANATTIQFNTAPANGAAIRIYRDTDDASLAATFYSGSAIRAQDLNDNFTQNLYVTQEVNNNSVNIDGSNPMVGPLNMNGFQITNLPVPAVDTNAATKKYVDDRFGNLDIPGHTRWRKVATASQTIFSGTGDYGGVLAYSPTREQVYINGALQQRGVDYAADNGTSVVFTVGLTVGDVVDIICVNNLTNSSVSNAGNITYSGQFSGQTARTVAAKLGEVVSVLDFGADPTGQTNSATAIQAAINTGKSVFLPNGVYKLGAPLTLSTVGQRLFGESSQNTYLTGGLNHDQVRIAASHCEVDHIHFRPDGASAASPPAFAPIRIYAALAHVHDNRFLSPVSGSGTAIYMDDVNPATSAVVAGAYNHTISENRIGAGGYEWKTAIYAYNNNNGQQATKIQNNQIIANTGIFIEKGGGNYIVGNLLQSHTGTYGSPVGTGIFFNANVLGETVTGNYIERYEYGIATGRAPDQYIAYNAYGNHYDHVTNTVYSLNTGNYAYFDEFARYHYINTWQHRYDSQDNYKLFNREGIEVLNVNRASAAVEPKVLAFNTYQSLSYPGNGTTQTPTSSFCEITGGGSSRTGCFLGNGSRPGQILYLRGATWPVEILNNPGGTQNIMFNGSAASATFGSSAGQIQMMQLIWDGGYGSGRWFEVSRTVI
jgi:hypothetical protein